MNLPKNGTQFYSSLNSVEQNSFSTYTDGDLQQSRGRGYEPWKR